MNAGTATDGELRMLKALCTQQGDNACRNKVSALLAKKQAPGVPLPPSSPRWTTTPTSDPKAREPARVSTGMATGSAGGRAAWERFGLAAALSYSILHALPFPLGFPGTERLAAGWNAAEDAAVGAAARAWGVAVVEPASAGGDSAGAWLALPLHAGVAVLCGLGAVVVRARADRLRPILRAWLRYWVGASMLSYGVVKVLKSQFPALQPSDLATSYAESSPMGLLWRFMSASTGYCVFTGLVEVIGGLLLLHRRTTLLGALLVAAAMTNVVALNLAYDVNVKIGSVHLLAAALALAAPDARRLAAALLGRAAPPKAPEPPLVPGRAGVLGPWALAAGLVVATGHAGLHAYRTWGDGAPPMPGMGLYDVISGTGAAAGWRQVTFDRQGFVAFGADRSRAGFDATLEGGTLTVSRADAKLEARGVPDTPETIELDGRLGPGPARVVLRRVPREQVRLTSRGFHWVNEGGYYR